jgi:hypothetical protein
MDFAIVRRSSSAFLERSKVRWRSSTWSVIGGIHVPFVRARSIHHSYRVFPLLHPWIVSCSSCQRTSRSLIFASSLNYHLHSLASFLLPSHATASPFISHWATAESAPPFKLTLRFLRALSLSRDQLDLKPIFDSRAMHDVRRPLVASRSLAIGQTGRNQ